MKHSIIFGLLMTFSWSLVAAPAMDTALQPVKPGIATGGSAGDMGGGSITPLAFGGGAILTVIVVSEVIANPGKKAKKNGPRLPPTASRR